MAVLRTLHEVERYSPDGTSVTILNDRQHVGDSLEHTFERSELPSFYAKRRKRMLLEPQRLYDVTIAMSRNSSYRADHPSGAWSETTEGWQEPLLLANCEIGGQAMADLVGKANGAALVLEAMADAENRPWDALTFAAEFGKTVELFTGIRKRLAVLTAANAWLEYRYGWRILAYDLEDMAKTIKKIDKNGPALVRTVARRSVSIDDYEEQVQESPYHTLKTFVRTKGQAEVQGRIHALYSPPPITGDILVTAWELTTLSFVLDWIVNVGDWLSAWSFAMRDVPFFASIGTIGEVTREAGILSCTGKSDWTVNAQYTGHSTITFKTRERVQPDFLNGYGFKKPKAGLAAILRGLDLVALYPKILDGIGGHSLNDLHDMFSEAAGDTSDREVRRSRAAARRVQKLL